MQMLLIASASILIIERQVKIMIYNDINESNYTFKYDKLTFYFSSNFYKEKFIKEYINFIHDETMKLRIKFKCGIYCDEMILLLLYKKIEKRGFKVLYNDKQVRENYFITSTVDAISYESQVIIWQLDMIKN